MPPQKDAPKSEKQQDYSFVAQDRIWKDNILQERSSAKVWPNNWSFLATDYKDLVRNEYPVREKKKFAPAVQVRPATPLEQRVTVLPSKKPPPVTTSGMVGWRSSERSLQLEKYGRYTKPKGNIIKTLKWPEEYD